MSFTNPIFLFLFLPISLLIYQLTPTKLKNIYILLISLFFYSWSEWAFLPAILGSMLSTWTLGSLMTKFPKQKTIFLVIGIILSVGLLIYSRLTTLHLGLSFFTFHSLSYLIDIFTHKVAKSGLINTGIYLLFFPQLGSGPINKYSSMVDQLTSHRVDPKIIGTSITRFIIGLGQKLLLANTFGILVDQIFLLNQSDLSFATAWLGVIAYTLQIYFDFAGYSNMAIGVASLFGFKFAENFNLPYTAISITDFWGRWHISLTSWLREYVYFPLGGNRKGCLRTYLNIAIVFLVSGIWHGMGWNFVIWGLWHGLFMILEKWRGWTRPGHLYTLLIVIIGWVLFRSNDLVAALSYLHKLIPTLGGGMPSQVYWLNYMSPYMLVIFGIAVLLAFGIKIKIPPKFAFIKFIGLSIILFLSLLSVAGNTYSAFIYFKF